MSHFQPDDNKRMLALFTIVLVIFSVLILFSSCSPARKLAKLEKEHPDLFKNSTHVTVRHDTLISKEIHKDSTIHNIYSRNTVFLKENRLTVKYLYKGGDSAYLGGSVRADTVIKVVADTLRSQTIVKTVIKPKTGWDWLQFWLTMAVLAFVIGKYGGPIILKILQKIPGFPF